MKSLCTVAGPAGTIEIGPGRPLTIIAGPCALESRDLGLRIGEAVRDACAEMGFSYIFKASYDKANRTSVDSKRGPGLESGLRDLEAIRAELGVPVTTDIHEPAQAGAVAEVVDVLQIPAFLCRQTDLLVAASEAASARAKAVNIKKGQFLSPEEMRGPVRKCTAAGCSNLMLTERGTFFGYHRLVTDVIGLGDLMALDTEFDGGPALESTPPVCFDATHSAQLPGASKTTGGRRDRIPMLAAAAVACSVDAVFMECHPEPERALSDAATMLRLDAVPALLARLKAVREAIS
ncbi:3-deoxy-8-phosphooctulonate synthase [Phycisphaerales bacterium ac7]